MSATPRASFVIPARNAADTLARTLDSLLAQGDRAWETITSMAQQGVRFGSHLATHCAADGLSTDELADELLRSRQALARWTGLAPCALAAPYGVSDARLEQIAAECGYRIGFGSQHGAASLDSQPMRCPRIEVRGDMLLDELAHALEACR